MSSPASSLYYPPPGYTEVHMSNLKVARRRPLFWQFLRVTCAAFLVSAVTWFLISGNKPEGHLTHVASMVTAPHGSKHSLSECFDRANWMEPTSGPGEFAFRTRTTLTLPLSAEELYFAAVGTFQYGQFEVSVSPAGELDPENAIVDIEAYYSYSNAFYQATVCRTHPDKSNWGLTIFTPYWNAANYDRSLYFHIHLRLPAAPSGELLQMNALRTYLPFFSHHLPELADLVYFDSIKLESENAPIQADYLSGNRVLFRSGNGAVGGRFEVASLLDLHTSNAPINVQAKLTNGGETTTTYLFLQTSDGRIDGDLTLVSNASDATAGHFHVAARSLNAPLALKFLDAPVDSVLAVAASTSNAPARVALHKTFEGVFDLASSSTFRPEVDRSSTVSDPAKHGRTRLVRLHSSSGAQQHGSVFWGEHGKAWGKAVVQTTNAPLTLLL